MTSAQVGSPRIGCRPERPRRCRRPRRASATGTRDLITRQDTTRPRRHRSSSVRRRYVDRVPTPSPAASPMHASASIPEWIRTAAPTIAPVAHRRTKAARTVDRGRRLDRRSSHVDGHVACGATRPWRARTSMPFARRCSCDAIARPTTIDVVGDARTAARTRRTTCSRRARTQRSRARRGAAPAGLRRRAHPRGIAPDDDQLGHLTTVSAAARRARARLRRRSAARGRPRARARRSHRRPAPTGSTPSSGRRRRRLVAAEVQRVGLDRLPHLLGELRELLGVLLDVLRPLVADRAQRLAGEAAADHRVVLVGAQQRFLVARHRARLGRRDEPGAEPHAVGAEAQRGREPAAVEDAARGDDRHPVADRVDDLRHERHRRDRAGVATRFGALRDHEVASGFDRGDRVPHLAAHARDEHVAVVQDLDDVARHAEPGDEQRRAAARRSSFASSIMRSRQRGEQVDAERLVGELAHVRRISSSIWSDAIAAAPSVPMPPASDTAATSWW